METVFENAEHCETGWYGREVQLTSDFLLQKVKSIKIG